jgi:hypothetical protein
MLAICRVYESFDATETPHNSCMKSWSDPTIFM